MIPSITVQEFRALPEGERPKLLDIREDYELEIASIPVEAHIPMGLLPERLGELDRDQPWAVLCRTGNRSGHVTRFLLGQGFAQVWNLAGGIHAWADEVDPSLTKY